MPTYNGGNIGRDNPSGARFRAPDFGPNGMAAGLGQMSRVLSGAAEEVDAINEMHDRAAVKEAANAVNAHYLEMAHTGPNAYFTKQGKAALETRGMVEKSLDTLIEQKLGGLQNERQQRMFEEAMTPQRQSWGANIAQYAVKETLAYEGAESKARVAMSGELARATYIADPEQGENYVGTALAEIDNVARIEGWGPDMVAAEKLKTASSIYRDVGQSLVSEGGANGPDLADALIERVGGSMTGDDRIAVQNYSRIQRNHFEVEQRRAEAEAKREASAQKAEAKDRAQSVYRNIQDGVYVDPKNVATAMSDAITAGDEALAEGLRQGGLKNALTFEWADATPSEIQNRVNDLSTQITKAGGKVSPDLIVERDHLQTLLGKTSADLRADPLSWGASRLGIDVGTLNTNDPASISNRISAATTIARRTGSRPVPLTNEEAAQYAPIVQSGSVKQKKELALTLAKFGELAPFAAEQVTSDKGFHNLVGLASLPNRSVAASRVNQVIEGQELLKAPAFANLVDKAQAQRMTGEFLGGALQFSPGGSEGIYANATAILASEANERGYKEWNEASGRWYAAINSALGAYAQGGKQYGGLHGFNGETTILPDNISGDEFETKISRAQGPQIKKAQNGSPMYADGSFATATEIKRMQWVPAGEGVYRIKSRGGFLTVPSGGYYEVNIGKLP